MKYQLMDYLVCPTCRSSLALTVAEEEQGQVKTGGLCCESGHQFAITRFVPRFVDADRYADSFSKQRLYVRRHFSHYARDRSGFGRFFPSTGFTEDEVRTGISLEVGCGYGRYLDVVERTGGAVVGVDLSTHSVDLAQDFVGLRNNVHVVQADLFQLPFRTASFDRVFSLGVLHHTPSTREAFEAIVPFASHGGQVSIWVYHKDRKVSADRWRVVTARLPHSVLYGWCVANQALFSWIRALPGGGRFNKIIPGGSPRSGGHFWLRVLGDFDNLSPTYAHSHTNTELLEWFADAGLSDVRVLDVPVAATGKRVHPAEPSEARTGYVRGRESPAVPLSFVVPAERRRT